MTFKSRIMNYSRKLIQAINKKIELEDKKRLMGQKYIEIISEEYKNIVPSVKFDKKIIENENETRAEMLQSILDTLIDEYQDNKKFYKNHKELNEIIKVLNGLINKINLKSEKISTDNLIIGSIINHLETFASNISDNETDKEKEYKYYKKTKQGFIKSITDVIKLETKEIKFPNFPKPIKGNSKNIYRGYYFFKKKKYDSLELSDDFYKELFVKEYNNLEKIKHISSKEELVSALNGISKYEDVDNWFKKVDNFIENYLKDETYIEKVSSRQSMGKTPGEISIVFYDFMLKNDPEEKNVIFIDQPEDDISNNNITSELINYIENNRDKKQIILVTHNPVLVVNLDVDNVILLNKNYRNVIEVKNGCLEYTNDDYSIIQEVAKNMDGGIETVEKRFRLYENRSKS